MSFKTKKFLSVLIAFCIVLSTFTMSSVTAENGDTSFYKITFDGETVGNPFYAITDDMEINSEDVSVNFRYYLEGDWDEIALVNLTNSEIVLNLNKGWNNCAVNLESYSGKLALGFKVMDATKASSAVVYLKNVAITAGTENIFNPTATQILENEPAYLSYVEETDLPDDSGVNDLTAYLIAFNNSPTTKGIWLGGTESDAKNKEIIVSFDYYLTDVQGGSVRVLNARGGSFKDDTTNSNILVEGKNSFKSTVAGYQYENMYPALASSASTTANIYIWNVKVTIGGVDYTNINANIGGWSHDSVEFTTLTYGDITFDSDTQNDAYIIEFNNSPASKGIWLGGTESDAKNKEIIVSFDYYLTDTQGGSVQVLNARGGSFKDDTTNSNTLVEGKNSFKSTVAGYQYENMYPAIASSASTTAKIYIWNVKVTIGGVDYTSINKDAWGDTSVEFTAMKYEDIPFDNGSSEANFKENAAYFPYEEGEYTSPYDVQADILRNDINELEDTAPKTSRVYYVSNNGSDSNNGRTPETAWATTAKLSSIVSYIPSTVLFERGGVYRGGFEAKENVTYGAYGDGEKPCIYGSLQNYADSSLWTEYADNIWKITVEGSAEIGNIVFDNGKKVGIKIVRSSSFSSLSEKIACLTEDYTFVYHDGAAYLYLSGGNPANVHSDIEIIDRALSPHIIDISSYAENITIENLCLKYANFGITAGNFTDNITIRGVEIGYIGGCVNESGVARWGNGIEFWGAKNLNVENCWIYQCYDAGFTHQADGNSPHDNIKFNNNLVEFCQYGIEAWNKDTGVSNIEYTNNIMRFAGYQVFDPKVRYGSDSSATSFICIGDINGEVYNFKVENNIFDTSYGYIFHGFNEDIEYNNNSYLQQSQLETYFYTKNEYCDMVTAVLSKNGTVYKAIDEYSFEKGVEIVEPSFKEAIYVMHKDTGIYKVCFNEDIAGGQFCTITDDIAVDLNKVTVNFDYFYDGKDATADVVNLNTSQVLCTLENGWNSCSASIENFSGEMCVGIRNKDATAGLDATLYIKNPKITVGGENIINTAAKQFFKIKPAYILNVYEEDAPYESVPGDKEAYLIDFSNTTAGSPYRKLTADPYGEGKSIKISFSYYLTDAEDKDLMVYNLAGGSFQDEVTDKNYLYKGRHNFSYQLDVLNEKKSVCVAIGLVDAAVKSNAKLYIWDVSITVNGTEYFDENTAQWYQGIVPEMNTMQFSDIELNGDSNDDGVVDIADFVRLKKYLANEKLSIKKSNVNIYKDSDIDALDLTEFRKILLGCYYN